MPLTYDLSQRGPISQLALIGYVKLQIEFRDFYVTFYPRLVYENVYIMTHYNEMIHNRKQGVQ